MPLKRSQIICPVFSLLNSPQPATLIIATASEQSTIRVKGDRAHQAVVALQCTQTLSRFYLPHLDSMIAPTTGKQCACGIESHGDDIPGVIMERLEDSLRAEIPDLNCLIIAAAGEQSAIRVKGDRAHPAAMASQRTQALPATEIPEP